MSQDEFAPQDPAADIEAPPLPPQEQPRVDAEEVGRARETLEAAALVQPSADAADAGVPGLVGEPPRPAEEDELPGAAGRGVVADQGPAVAAGKVAQVPHEGQQAAGEGAQPQQAPPAAAVTEVAEPAPAVQAAGDAKADPRRGTDEFAGTQQAAYAGAAREGEDADLDEEEYHPRQVRLALSRIEPWSVMKVTFLLSVALGIATVLAALLVWLVLNGMAVFSGIEKFVNSIDSSGTVAALVNYLRLPRVLALTTIVAVANIALLTALSTIGAMLYNLVASLVGGVTVRLQDD